jgi:hypothetical protein
MVYVASSEELVLWPTASQPVRLGIGLPFGPHDQILSSFPFDNYVVVLPRAPSLARGQVCNLQCNRLLVRSLRTNNHTLPSHLRLCSLFVASHDSQGGILTCLHMGKMIVIENDVEGRICGLFLCALPVLIWRD